MFVELITVNHCIRDAFTNGHVDSKGSLFADAGAIQELRDRIRAFSDSLETAGQLEFSLLYSHASHTQNAEHWGSHLVWALGAHKLNT